MFLNETIEQLTPVIEQKNVELHWDGTPGFLRVWIDKEKMTAIIRGMLEIIVDNVDDGEEIELTTAYTSRSWEMKLEFSDGAVLKKNSIQQKRNRYQFIRCSKLVVNPEINTIT